MRLSPEDAVILYETAPLHALMSSALLRRQQQVPGGEVTYLIDRNVNYTNACTINCQFCSFYRPIGHDEVYTQTIDEISQRLSELEAIGGVRVLMQGGVNPTCPFRGTPMSSGNSVFVTLPLTSIASVQSRFKACLRSLD